MKLRLVVEVPLPLVEGEERGDFFPKLDRDTMDIERTFPNTAVVMQSEYVPEVEDTAAIFRKFLRFKLESGMPRGFTRSEYYEKGDEDAPFFSEAFLYPLLGKDDARTVLAYLHSLMTTCGLDPQRLEREVNAELAAEKQAEEKRIERVAKLKKFKAEFIKAQGWKSVDTFTGLEGWQDIELRKAMKDAGL